VERVAAGTGPEHLRRGPPVAARLEHATQPGDVRLQRGSDLRRRCLVPDLVDEVLDRHRTSGRRDEQADQDPRLEPAQVEDLTGALDLEGSEHPDPHAARP
jgi:hypothetical protein